MIDKFEICDNIKAHEKKREEGLSMANKKNDIKNLKRRPVGPQKKNYTSAKTSTPKKKNDPKVVKKTSPNKTAVTKDKMTASKVKTTSLQPKKTASKPKVKDRSTTKATKIKFKDQIDHTTSKKQVIEIAIPKEENSKSNRRLNVMIWGLSVLLIGGVIGRFLYVPIKVKARNNVQANCTYGEWREDDTSYCLISPEGNLYESDTVKYEEKDGGCVKYVRSRTCSYES